MKLIDRLPTCAHTDQSGFDPYLILSLEKLEQHLMQKLTFGSVNSGLRCEKCNSKAGGVLNSAHIMGKAVDIGCPSSRQRFSLLCAIFALQFSRVGIAKTFIHVDVDLNKPHEVAWLY